MIYKPTRREFLKYAGIAATAFGVPMLLKVREAQAAITRGVGPLYFTITAGQTNNGSLVGTTIGRSLVVVIFWYDPAGTITPTITISGESNATPIAGSKFTNDTANNNASGQIFYLANNTGGGDKTITCDLGSPGNYADIAVMEYAGMDTSSQPDNWISASGATATATTSLSTITANALIVAGGINNTIEFIAGSGYTLFGGAGMTNTIHFEEAQDNIAAGVAGAKTVAFTAVVSNWALTAASFKAAGGGVAPVRHKVIGQ